MPAPVLAVRDVSLKFGDLRALHQVSIEVPADRTIGLIGPNGAGKTTLLNVIAGRQVPNTGQIEFAGADVTNGHAVDRARLGIRRTFQDQALFTEMSVRDNLLVASGTVKSSNGRTGRRARAAHVDELVDSLGLGPWLHSEVQTLPHPVQRLVAYARAIAGEPQLLLLDEPAAGLSESARQLLAAQLRKDIADRRLSVIVVEHDMGFIRQLCDQAYVLNAGQIIAYGPFEEIAANAEVKSAYLGDWAEN